MTSLLVAGQNRPLASPRVEVDVTCLPSGFALAVLPLGASTDTPFAGALDAGARYLSAVSPGRYAIDLDALDPGTEAVALIAYSIRHERTMNEVPSPSFVVDGSAIAPSADSAKHTALAFARLYRHQGNWKVRALSEGSRRGLSDLGRLFGCVVDEGGPPGVPSPHAGQGSAPDWSGTGFMVAPGLVITNAHVVQNAREIIVAGFEGRSLGEPIIVDGNCDLALVRVDRSLGSDILSFRIGAGPGLGETAIALGYPLAGFLGSGPQVAHGTVSGLLGPEDDTRVLQITTPIQGGSSGGPVLDAKGRVIGVVAAMLRGAQNVNFAVRGCLAQALVEAAGKAVAEAPEGPDLDIAAVTRLCRGAVWRIDARQ